MGFVRRSTQAHTAPESGRIFVAPQCSLNDSVHLSSGSWRTESEHSDLLPWSAIGLPCSSGIVCFRFHFDPFVGTEELGHLEMIGAIVHQLTRNLKDSQIRDSSFAPYFVDHTTGVYPTAAAGAVYNTGMMQVKGDPIADLAEDLGAEATFH